MQFHSDALEFCGYFPGVVGDIIKLHAVYYNENWGFDVTFETQVSSELANFIREFQKDRDDFIVARLNGKLAGSVAIDGRGAEFDGARLRWFLVEPDFQNRGIGRALIRKVIRFCRDVGHDKVFLWTFKGLDSARRMYELEGFRLSEEHLVEQWGAKLLEQKFVYSLLLTSDQSI
ncbi:MAG: GNAT family N-acetyltransferase [Desulfomonile sp.]|jgi:GNAT superfamily N-acetyltransferase